MLDPDNLFPQGYTVSDITLLSVGDEQSTLERIARFTIKCGELANLDYFSNMKLMLFSNSVVK